jgi:hypothetical protein
MFSWELLRFNSASLTQLVNLLLELFRQLAYFAEPQPDLAAKWQLAAKWLLQGCALLLRT